MNTSDDSALPAGMSDKQVQEMLIEVLNSIAISTRRIEIDQEIRESMAKIENCLSRIEEGLPMAGHRFIEDTFA